MVDSVATQRLYRSDIHQNQDVTVDFSDVQVGRSDVLVTIHAAATAFVNRPGLNGNTGIHCIVSAIDEKGHRVEFRDTDFNYPSSGVTFSAACSSAVVVQAGRPIQVKASCVAYGQQGHEVEQRQIQAIVIVQAIKHQPLTSVT